MRSRIGLKSNHSIIDSASIRHWFGLKGDPRGPAPLEDESAFPNDIRAKARTGATKRAHVDVGPVWSTFGLQGCSQRLQAGDICAMLGQDRDVQIGQRFSVRARSVEVHSRDGGIGRKHTLGRRAKKLQCREIERGVEKGCRVVHGTVQGYHFPSRAEANQGSSYPDATPFALPSLLTPQHRREEAVGVVHVGQKAQEGFVA